MPRDKDFKRLVRTRMEKAGESYTGARARILQKDHTREDPAGPAREDPTAESPTGESTTAVSRTEDPSAHDGVAPDHAALAGMSNETIAARTGCTWERWVYALDRHEAAEMPHGEIARLVQEKFGIDGWWAQTVTVGYERIKGLRERGQPRGGLYEAGKSRTFDVHVGVLFDAWADDATRRAWMGGEDPAVSTATRPRSMRLRWPDGTLVGVWFTDKGEAKSAVQVQHAKLPDRDAIERTKGAWAARLAALAELLVTRGD